VLTDAEKPQIEKAIEAVCKEGQRFERIVVTRDEALSMFQENKFKVTGCGALCLCPGICVCVWGCARGVWCAAARVQASVCGAVPGVCGVWCRCLCTLFARCRSFGPLQQDAALFGQYSATAARCQNIMPPPTHSPTPD
jgi:hypothetical protein